ncbi:MAG: aminotransferase [Microbacteriaceae bacterium]|jgi:selenocysteine lyase/cysteine desulfurase|nr:aminotransferase [Microbacteriaceae bacterium]HEV7957496.1 aminotransferase class V-fold PLP-dependent enzyme [Marisediminicola sp.]
MTAIDEFAADFDEEPGFLDFARVGPPGHAVLAEQRALGELLRRARFGSLEELGRQDERMRVAVADLIRFRPDQVVSQPNTSSGLMHTMFGFTGGVALSAAEFPSVTFAAVRAAESLHVLNPTWLDTDYGKVTPGAIRDQLTPACGAVALSIVDFRTGYLADLDGIRQVIGDRLLIVDAIQGFGIVDAPWEVADVIVSGGQKWVRAGWGTGFLALSDRAAERLTPVMSGFAATLAEEPLDEVLPPRPGAGAFSISRPDPVAEAMFATALENIAAVGVEAINGRIAERVTEIIDLADEYAIQVASTRAENERAGIVVLAPDPDQLTMLTASLYNHGITATTRGGQVRLSAHVSTGQDTLAMLRAAMLSFGTAVIV